MASNQPVSVTGKGSISGRIIQMQVVPAKGAAAFDVGQGQIIRIVDVEGKQVPDVLVYDRSDFRKQVSVRYSLSMNFKQHLTTGDVLYDLDCVPMVTIVADTVGKHWWGGAFCSEELRHFWTGMWGLKGCRDNFAAALAPFGIAREDIRDGGCLNFFMNMGSGGIDGSKSMGAPFSDAGDYVDLRAERDILVAISACPDDLTPVNDFRSKPLAVVVYQPS
ncbi:MAG: DUF1989 domain-containing protein [Chloroflexota bacterium]